MIEKLKIEKKEDRIFGEIVFKITKGGMLNRYSYEYELGTSIDDIYKDLVSGKDEIIEDYKRIIDAR